MIKILFGEPGIRHAEGGTQKFGKQTPNIGLAYVVTYVAQRIPGVQVKTFDKPLLNMSNKEYLDLLKNYKPNIVALTSMSFNISDAYKLFKITKSYDKNIRTVLGGCHATTLSQDIFKESCDVDIVIVGEGEKAFEEIIKNPNLKGVVKVPFIEDLDSLPFPDWSLFDYDKYELSYSKRLGKSSHIYNISMKRGCPFSCIFCNGGYLGKKSRERSAENVFQEIKYNVEHRNAEIFYITDSSFTINIKDVQILCHKLIDSGISKKIAWKTGSRVDLADKKTFELMYEAGCELLFFGIESGVNKTLTRIKKRTNLTKIKESVQMAKDAGLRVTGSFIAGLPGDTKADVEKSIEFANTLGLSGYAFHILDIYPGTEVWNMVMNNEQGMRWAPDVNPGNWDVYNRHTAMAEVNDLDTEYLNKLHERL